MKKTVLLALIITLTNTTMNYCWGLSDIRNWYNEQQEEEQKINEHREELKIYLEKLHIITREIAKLKDELIYSLLVMRPDSPTAKNWTDEDRETMKTSSYLKCNKLENAYSEKENINCKLKELRESKYYFPPQLLMI